jgi:GMP synthase (glutamine-hydrolysing)
MQKILVIVQQQSSDAGRMAQMLCENGYILDIRCPSQQEKLPATMDDYDAVAVFGGRMSVNDSDTLPFIRAELDWIPVALESDKPFLGICLGAQLLAHVLGATVAPHPQGLVEIGYFPVMPTLSGLEYFPETLHVYEWHGEGFELPQGAALLASGEVFANQAFRYGKNAYGLQFHPEITAEIMYRWVERGIDQLTLPRAQPYKEQIQQHALYSPIVENWLKEFLKLWLKV